MHRCLLPSSVGLGKRAHLDTLGSRRIWKPKQPNGVVEDHPRTKVMTVDTSNSEDALALLMGHTYRSLFGTGLFLPDGDVGKGLLQQMSLAFAITTELFPRSGQVVKAPHMMPRLHGVYRHL